MKANLVVLGTVSSVESYFRAVIRKSLRIDDEARETSYRRKISYGAVLFHDPELLPEALMEESTFLNKESIKTNLKEFIGLKINLQQEPDLDKALEEYEKVCQLRHCIAHRSGHLGSKNAIELGLNQLSKHLEKPICLTLDSVNNVLNICQNLVFECNDYIFEALLERQINKEKFTGDLRIDKKNFKLIYEHFSLNPLDNEDLKKLYKRLIRAYGM